MKNGIMVSVVIALLVGSSAIAQIDLQYGFWNFNVTNSMDAGSGQGSLYTVQGIGTANYQTVGINPDTNGDPTSPAQQGFGLAIFQEGNVGTNGAPVGLDQGLHIQGLGQNLSLGLGQSLTNPPGQAQSVGYLNDPVVQYQGTSMVGYEDLTKEAGSKGNVDGLSVGGVIMGHGAGNTCANGVQLSVVLGGQYSELSGAAQSTGEIHTDMTGTVQQYQQANGTVVP
jgi:hypothetical protein